MKKLLLILLYLPILFSCGEDNGSKKKDGKDAKHEKNDSKRSKKEKDIQSYLQITLEVMVVDVIKELSNNSTDADFNLAITNTLKAQDESKDDFVTFLGMEYERWAPAANRGLSTIFTTRYLRDKVQFTSTNQEVIAVLKVEVEDAISSSFNILRTRIDRFGVKKTNIQRIQGTARILIELPRIKDSERLRKLLQSTGNLEFWETYEYTELFQGLESANAYLRETADADTLTADSAANSLSSEEFDAENPLYALLYPNVDQQSYQLNSGPVVGFCAVKDTTALNVHLKDDAIRKFFPKDVKFAYTVKPYDDAGKFVQLIALKSDRNGKPAMEGDVVTNANEQLTTNNQWEISMSMNQEGARKWKRLTKDNIEKSVAIVLDGYVYSFPTVQAEISGGRSSITGNFNQNEAKDLVNILKSGRLPVAARIIEETIVGPSLGEEAISSGLRSFAYALLVVLAYMIFYYNGAGLVSNIALLANLFFIFGVLASLGAVLTLPGIAGIILTIGMSVDANVLIYERIREEMRNGKGLSLAITDGYNNAYSSIIDANVTTLLTGIILYTFGTGPIKGFATTLIIGILTSLFAAIFITRLVISSRLKKGKTISFATKLTEGAFKNINFDFMGKRKRFYILSSIIILLGIGSLATRGLHYGVDFAGGRTYLVHFDETVDNEALRTALTDVFVDVDANGLKHTPEVKTVGDDNEVKITTSFMIDNDSITTDSIVTLKLLEGLASTGVKYKIDRSQKIGPTIAEDIKDAAVWSVIFSLLVIFLYILVRFRKWQFSLGAIVAVFHDVLIVLSIFSIFYGVLPFSLEIDQAFIAAILTIIGYSLNDTVVVFDRIREYMIDNKKKRVRELINGALNSTLSRTINTSLTTFCVLLIIFIFGADMIKGFMFALMVGVVVGTYSSLFVASPIMMDTIKEKEEKSNRK